MLDRGHFRFCARCSTLWLVTARCLLDAGCGLIFLAIRTVIAQLQDVHVGRRSIEHLVAVKCNPASVCPQKILPEVGVLVREYEP